MPTYSIDRYEIKEILGQGGMGIVYKAYDSNRKGYVALKTMKDAADSAALELFNQEWRTLANLSHPNIVDVLNFGEFEENGQRKPFFVMPLLPGKTLDKLIKEGGHRLTIDRVIEILVQTCRGLQAAHSTGLVHRDLKPSNLFILNDDSVKIIDFGMVHLADAQKSVTGIKGTLHYMAPEQIEMKEVTAATDIFALGVVGFEALTGRKPFERPTERGIVEAIRHEFPPPASDLNPGVAKALSQVLAKAMAKNPWNRFGSAREFADYLQQAAKGEALDAFDAARLQPRLERARNALSDGDYEYAHEILNELQLEGHLSSEINLLFDQVKEASRHRAIRQLLDSARTRMQEEEYPLAWQKIQEVLQRDPGNTEAVALQAEIDTRRSDQKIEKWRKLVQQHLHNHAFTQARHAIEEIRNIRADDPSIKELLQLTDQRQRAYQKACEEKEQHFQSAMRSYTSGEISTALSKLEKIFEVDNRTPGFPAPGRDEVYRETYNKVRSEWESVQHAHAEIERVIASGDLPRASELVADQCVKYPNDLALQATKLKVEDLLRQEKSAYIAETSRRVESEPDLNRRVQYLEEALARYPKETHFEELANSLRKRRDLVEGIVAKARQYEDQNLLAEALGQWTTLRNIYPHYPGLDFELDRVVRRREQQRSEESRLDVVSRIDHLVQSGDYYRAHELANEALATFPGDQELQALSRLIEDGRQRNAEAVELMAQAEQLTAAQRHPEAVEALRRASGLAPNNPAIRDRFADALAVQAKSAVSQGDWRNADALVMEAFQLVPEHVLAKSVRPLILLAKRAEFINDCVARARDRQAAGDLSGALDKVQQGLAEYPNDGRLVQLRNTLREQTRQRRDRDLQELRQLSQSAERERDRTSLTALLDRSLVISRPYPDDGEFTEVLSHIQQHAALPDSEETKAYPTTDSGAAASPTWTPEPPPQPEAAPGLEWRYRVKAAVRTVETFFTDAVWKPAVRASGSAAAWTSARYAKNAARFRQLPPMHRVGVAAVPVVLALIVVALAVWKTRPAGDEARPVTRPGASVGQTFLVTINPDVDGATLYVDGEVVDTRFRQLAPGAHSIRAEKLGYRPATEPIVVGSAPVTVNLTLTPEPQLIRISTDLRTGRVFIRDEEVGVLQDGAFTCDLSGFQEQVLRIVDGKTELFSVFFETKPGQAAVLTKPPFGRDVPVAVISSLGRKAFIQSNVPNMKVTLPGGEPQPIAGEGSELMLPAGDHQLIVDAGDNRPVTIPVDAGNAPLISVSAGVVNKGTIVVEANIPQADVYIDGRKSSRRLQQNKWTGPAEPGEHRVRVEAPDYEQQADRMVTVAAGKRVTAPFELVKIITTAFLRVEGGTAGADVVLDGNRVGVLDNGGSFGPIEVAPDAHHSIRFRKADHESSAELTRSAKAKETIVISGTDARLKPYGSIVIGSVQPPSAVLTLHRKGDPSSARKLAVGSLPLPEGIYVVNGSTDMESFYPIEKEVRIASGQAVRLDIVLPQRAAAPKAPPRRKELPELFSGKWDAVDAGFWHTDGNTYAHEVTFSRVLDARRIKGKIKWETYTQNNDKVEFEVDGKNYSRRVITGRSRGDARKIAHGISGPEYRIEMTVRPDGISVKVGKAEDSVAVKVEGRTVFTEETALRLVR